MSVEISCVVDSADALGEGPVWDEAAGRLWWFDILGRILRWYAPASGETGEIALPIMASAAAPRADGGLIVATEQGIAAFDADAETLEVIHPAAQAGFRSNDGRIDVNGRFWWSQMDDGGRPGAFLRHDPTGVSTRVIEDVVVPNACCCSPDGRTLYWADSALRTIFASDMDPATGALGARREFANTKDQPGVPDGSCVDAQGYVWNAQWDGWRIVRYAPDGRIDRVIEMPVQRPTCCEFGGAGLTTLYVTSARVQLSDEDLKAQPQAGGLFALDLGVAGLRLPPFAG